MTDCPTLETVANVAVSDIEVTPEMIEAAAEELWDWILRSGYNDTFSVEIAREPAAAILRAAYHQKVFF